MIASNYLRLKHMHMNRLTQNRLIFLISLFFVLFYNYTFFKDLLEVYPPTQRNIAFLLSLVPLLTAFIALLLLLLANRWTIKPLLIILLLLSSAAAYFMNSYHTVIDTEMIRNILQTNSAESEDLLSSKLLLYLLVLGILPSIWVYRVKIVSRGFKTELFARIKAIFLALSIVVGTVLLFSKHYTSFLREHKPLRYTTNPTYWIYSIGKYINLTYNADPEILQPIGTDAVIADEGNRTGRLIVVVTGEALRAENLSLNGYQRETTPLLEKENALINFPDFFSCGTSTAVSVPCMFSPLTRSEYSYRKGRATENVLDVLKHTDKIAILWRDNNSDSKGVALRIDFEDFRDPQKNPVCDGGECRDIGMLQGLKAYIAAHPGKDILIVLHQMGNHGPAYYKRYPKAFEKFKPICKTNQLENCSRQEIVNAYDNAVLYTDYFLKSVITFLKGYDNRYKTAMLYISDHGESLGENGVYLHGLPYFMAPDTQTHVAAMLWLGKQMRREIDIRQLRAKSKKRYSHDNLFHTLLGIFHVKTEVYNRDMDMIHGKS